MNETGSSNSSSLVLVVAVIIIAAAGIYFKTTSNNQPVTPVTPAQPATTQPVTNNKPSVITQTVVTNPNHLPPGLVQSQPQAACNQNSPASIVVTSPSAGAVLTIGQQTTITWTACHVANVNISMAIGGHDLGLFNQLPVPASTGSYAWTVSSTEASQQNIHSPYQIIVEGADSTDNTINGRSGTFTIN